MSITNTALAKRDENTAIAAHTSGMTREQLELIKRTIAKETSDDEFALFMSTANRLGLDPFARQLHAVMRWDSRENRKVMSIQVSIDGFRAIADRSGELDGQDGPYWCGDDGVWHEAWLKKEHPSAAKVVVYRKGHARGYTGIATFASYVQTDRTGKPNSMWQRLSDAMLAKCAEALALRKACPSQLAGVYTTDEMGQASNEHVDRDPPRAEPPRPERTAEPLPIEDAEVIAPANDATPTAPMWNEISLEREWQALWPLINAAQSADELKALFPRYQALPKGSAQRTAVYDAMQLRKQQLDDGIPF